ncbi:MAG: hypothetical protein AAFY88_04915, partial [Acidobacteriota bacterium]
TNPDRIFTIRAAVPGSVFLDGGGSQRVFRYIVTNNLLRGSVTFEGLTFRNGFSTAPAFGSAITLENADATFIDCLFINNVNQTAGAGSGTVGLRLGTTAYFLRTTLQDNTSLTSGGGMAVLSGSTLFCQDCLFLRNRNNLPGHSATATGGGFVAAGGSKVYLANSRFEGNEAGFAGGAFEVKGLFTDGSPVELVAANSTFIDNVVERDPSVSTNAAVGGAVNVEDNALAEFYNSRFFENRAARGGAIGVYRAELEVYDSTFEGNYATGISPSTAPRGGAIFAVSDDIPVDGASNRPNADVLIRDSFFDGDVPAGAGQTATAQTGGCIYSTGDINRFLGQGVSQNGTQAQNSAILDIARTAFVDCDVSNIFINGPFGGGVYTALTILTIADSLFVNGDATGTGGAGGALGMVRFSDATITGTTFANNSSDGRGGAIFTLGSDIDINGCTFFENLVPGASAGASRGAAIFAGPFDGGGLDVTGVVQNSTFTGNVGIAIFDDDRLNAGGVFNRVTYRNNDFFPTTFAPSVYRNAVSGVSDVSGLNSLVVDRGSGNTTDKAPLNNNVALGSAPIFGDLLAVPPAIIQDLAVGDTGAATQSKLVYAWTGACAELDGGNLAGTTGFTNAGVGAHSLAVFDDGGCTDPPSATAPATITLGPTADATLTADPVMITGGGASDLSWTTPSGAFLGSALNQGEGDIGAATGMRTVTPSLTTTYTYFAVTQEGGEAVQATVFVDEDPPMDDIIFTDGFESGNTSAWSATIN